MRRFPFTFENLGPAGDPHRGSWQIARELNAQANNLRPDPDRPRPKGIALAEAIGHRLPRLDHYGHPIRDPRKPGRANLALYVLDRLDVDHEWVDLAETWPRTDHPGAHPPRSILSADVEDWRVVVGHAPPVAPRSGDARAEWLDAMVAAIRDVDEGTPVLVLSDPNGLGPDLVHRLGPGVVSGGTPTDAVHGRRVILDAAAVPGTLNGVPMLTDHRRVLVGRARRRNVVPT